jgi:IS30 family transposase
VGHFKVEGTVTKIVKHLANTEEGSKIAATWQNADMRRDVTAFIHQCPCCQKMAALQPLIHTHPYTTSTWGVFDNLSIDVIMGLPKSSQGNTNIMVIIDTFSRYIELVPMKALTSQAAVRALNSWMSRYGRPLNILTDNASQFMKEYQATLDALGITNAKTHPYSHQENGIVERANKEVMRHLRDIVYDTRIKDTTGKITYPLSNASKMLLEYRVLAYRQQN